MTEIVLRITYEGTFGTLDDVRKRYIDVIKDKNGEYYYRFTKTKEKFNRISIKKRANIDEVDSIMKRLSKIHVPAFPKHVMGYDGGFTEMEVGGYRGKSRFRWWSSPPEGWEELDSIANEVISNANFQDQ